MSLTCVRLADSVMFDAASRTAVLATSAWTWFKSTSTANDPTKLHVGELPLPPGRLFVMALAEEPVEAGEVGEPGAGGGTG